MPRPSATKGGGHRAAPRPAPESPAPAPAAAPAAAPAQASHSEPGPIAAAAANAGLAAPSDDLLWLDDAPNEVRDEYFAQHPIDEEFWFEGFRSRNAAGAERRRLYLEQDGLDGPNQDGTAAEDLPAVPSAAVQLAGRLFDNRFAVSGDPDHPDFVPRLREGQGPRRGILAPDVPAVLDALAAPFPPDYIDWRIGMASAKGEKVYAKALAYLDNRAVTNRLDAVVGAANWRNEYRGVAATSEDNPGGFLCGLSLLIEGEWVTKWDGAGFSDFEAFKGGLSGAMKRAAVQWGIGRYLYNLPEQWVTVVSADQKGDRGVRYQPASRKRDREVPEFYWLTPGLPVWAQPGGTGEEYNAPRPGAYTGPRLTPPGLTGRPVSEAGYDGPRAAQAPRSGPIPGRAAPSAPPPTTGPPARSQAAGTPAPAQPVPGQPAGPLDTGGRMGAFGPTEKQVAFYQRLAESPVFTEEERRRAIEWLATKATRQTIKDQIDWLKRQVETRQLRPGKGEAAGNPAASPAASVPGPAIPPSRDGLTPGIQGGAAPLSPADPGLTPEAKDWSPTASAAVRGEVDVHVSDHPPSEKQVVFFCSLVDSHYVRPDERAKAITWLRDSATGPAMTGQIDRLQALITQRKADEKAGKTKGDAAASSTSPVGASPSPSRPVEKNMVGRVRPANEPGPQVGAEYEPVLRTICARDGGPSPDQARRYLTLVYSPDLSGSARQRELLSWTITKLTAANAVMAIAELEHELGFRED